MTGYESHSPQIWRNNNFTSGGWVFITSIQVTNGVPQSSCDGFAVLTNGNYLINDEDGDSGPPSPTYREYDHLTGSLITNLVIDSSKFGWTNCTGVVCDPNTSSLYFAVWNIAEVGSIVQTDFSGNVITNTPPAPFFWNCEEITVPLP